jgi:CRISPR-associated protein (TIGR03984 family)
MAEQSEELGLYVSRTKEADNRPLAAALADFIRGFGDEFPVKTYAVLYSPRSCFLALVSNGRFQSSTDEIDVVQEAVFEARVFNEAAELRWLNQANGAGPAVVLSGSNTHTFFDVEPEPFRTIVNGESKSLAGTIPQTYLLWGESVGSSSESGWTQFAEARIGSFFVPISNNKISDKNRVGACFTAIEYVGEYEDGNVAVSEERLTGITLA